MEFFGCDSQQLNSIEFWKKLLMDAIADAEIRVLNEHFYQFTPHGITGYLLLSASHTNTVISKATCMSFPLVGNPS